MNLLRKLFGKEKNEPKVEEKKSAGTVLRDRSLGEEKKQQTKSPKPVAEEQKNLEPITYELEEEKWKIGQTLLNEYKVEKYLGEGGMGTVYMLVQREMDNQPFAVKTLLASALEDEQRRKLFLQELRTWMDLPEHPNLTACRFFRTIEGRLAIFAEYVDGGSLKEWIRDKRLLKLEQILDVAIQFAWGLQEAHDHKVIHQDVKPANVLMTKDGIAKITDFGLASARNASRIELKEGHESTSNLVSMHGMTEAYCSPEQAGGQKLSHKTDIWSWGVSMLEMFIGSVTWKNGSIAGFILEDYVKKAPSASSPKMPDSVAEVLRKCLKEDPEERWNTLDEAMEYLQKIYRQETGKPYFREKPKPVSKTTGDELHDRRTIGTQSWDDPVKWLNKAFQAGNIDIAEMDGMIPQRQGSRKAQALVDLEIYEQAETIYARLIKSGRNKLEEELAEFYVEKAVLQDSIDDMPGAIESYNNTIEIYERLVYKEDRTELLNDLAGAYRLKGSVLSRLGDDRQAVALYDKTIEIRERLVYKEGRTELLNDLAGAYSSKGSSSRFFGEKRQAVALYDKTIEIRERLVYKEGRPELLNDLAGAYMNKATVLDDLGEKVTMYDNSIEIWERLVHKEGRTELLKVLAGVYSNKGAVLVDLRENRQAVTLYDKTIEIMERLVYKEGRTELLNNLAMAYLNKGAALSASGERRQAVTMYDKSIEIWERLVHKEGRTELLNDLAAAYTNKGHALRCLGENHQAVTSYNKAIETMEQLVYKKGRIDLLDDLASAYWLKGVVLGSLGENGQAVTISDKAIDILEQLVYKEGRTELLNDLASVYMIKGVALGSLGENGRAITTSNKAIDILERLVYKEGRTELLNDLALVYKLSAICLKNIGDTKHANEYLEKAKPMERGI